MSSTIGLPGMVRDEVEKLSVEKQKRFFEEYDRKKKSILLAYLLWFFLGLHYLYFGKIGIQFFYWLTLGGVLVWAFIDLFRIPGMVADHNKDVSIEVLKNLKSIGATN